MPETYAVTVAALLHDIGKFAQRAGETLDTCYGTPGIEDCGPNSVHGRWGAKFVHRVIQDPVIEDIVLHHQRPECSPHVRLSGIVQDADRLSTAIDPSKCEDDGKPDRELLRAAFSKIALDRDRGCPLPERVYPLRPLGIHDGVFPERLQDGMQGRRDSKADYKRLWKAFYSECEQLPRPLPIGALLFLLQKYTSALPSTVDKSEPDIPLYNHARTTAAIAHCLLSGEEQEPFLLIHGDFSGIRNFIYDTVMPAQAWKRAAHRLRGRSFWLTLFADAVVEEIRAECGLFEPSVLWNTGGSFLILAPNTAGNREAAAEISRRVNSRLLERYGGQLSITIAAITTGRAGIERFAGTLDRMALAAAELKKQKFLDCGISFEAAGSVRPITHYCSLCGAMLPGEGAGCPVCRQHEEIGTELARAGYIARGKGLPISFADCGLNRSYGLFRHPPSGGDAEVFLINETGNVAKSGASGFVFIGSIVPIAGDEILPLSTLSRLSPGSPRLGYIKADVDGLGKIFSQGLPEDQRSISRIHTISSQLQFFFTGYLNRICESFVVYSELCDACRSKRPEKLVVREEGNEGGQPTARTFYRLGNACDRCRREHAVSEFYLIYSGGDDLLIVGPWDEAIRLTRQIYEDFRKFTAENPDITLSAGVAIVSPGLPVSRAVRIADELLERAKNSGRDRISVFEECLVWREGTGERALAGLIPAADRMIEAVQKKKISRGMVYALLSLWNQSFYDLETMPPEKQREERIRRRRFLPHLKYLMKRNVAAACRQEIEELITPNFGWIKLPVLWTGLALRRDGRNRL